MKKSETSSVWNEHYLRQKSRLNFPDENLVRILSKLPIQSGKALDFGAGSGRHSFLLKSYGFDVVALDYAENSLKIIKETDPSIDTLHCESAPYPLESESFDVIVSWGVLHYNQNPEIQKILHEYRRILKNTGYLIGTLRAESDTHLKIQDGKIQMNDLKSAEAKLFSLEETIVLLKDFNNVKIGYMERSPIGELEKRICHWIFLAEK